MGNGPCGLHGVLASAAATRITPSAASTEDAGQQTAEIVSAEAAAGPSTAGAATTWPSATATGPAAPGSTSRPATAATGSTAGPATAATESTAGPASAATARRIAAVPDGRRANLLAGERQVVAGAPGGENPEPVHPGLVSDHARGELAVDGGRRQ